MVFTKKFSEFIDAALTDADNELVGVSGGLNAKSSKVVTWTTGTRPTPPFAGLLGYNTTIGIYEYWDGSDWVEIANHAALDATFIIKTASGYLPNAQVLASLTTGILKSTTTTGNLTISPSLTSIDGLTTAADQMIYTTASNTYAVTALTSLARTLLANTTASGMRSTLGLGTAAVKNATDNAETTVASAKGSFVVGHILVAGDTAGTVTDGGSPAGAGTVLSVGSGTGLTGGPITSTGTLSFASIAANSLWVNNTASPAVPTETSLAALSGVNDTNVTVTLSGNPNTALINATTVTLGWTGSLAATRGGTGFSSYNVGDTLYANTTTTLAKVPGNASGIIRKFYSNIHNIITWFTINNVNAKTSDYTVTTDDWTSLITVTSSSPVTITLPEQSNLSTPAGFYCWVLNLGSDVVNLVVEGAEILIGPSVIQPNQEFKIERPTTTIWGAFGSSVVPAALSKSDDTNITLSLSGSPSIALLQPTTITAGWTGILSPIRGGTGINNGTSTLTLGGNFTTTGAFTSNFTMTGNTSVTFPTSGTLATTSQLPTPAALTKVDDTNVTLTLGGTPTTALLQATSLTLGWTGLLSGTRGGTGVNNSTRTITYAGNLSFAGAFTTSGAFSVTQTYTNTTTVTFPTSGTLATTSQLPTPAALTKVDDTNVTLTLGGTPTTSLLQATSLTLGWTGTLSGTRGGTGVNNSTRTITYAGNLSFAGAFTTSGAFSTTLTATGTTTLTLPTTGTLATTADIPTGAAFTRTNDANVTVLLSGSPTTAVLNAMNIQMGWSGFLPVSRGGTGITVYNVNDMLYAPSTSGLSRIGSVSSSILVTNGSGLPGWTTTLPAFTTSTITFSPTTAGLVGTTTNNNTTAGNVGEEIESIIAFGSAVSLTTATNANVTSISLTAGDWDVWGNVSFAPSISITNSSAWSSSTSVTLPDASLYNSISAAQTATTGFSIPGRRFSLSGTTTVYLSAVATFGAGTCTACGGIYARRRR